MSHEQAIEDQYYATVDSAGSEVDHPSGATGYNITLHVWEGNDSARSFYEKSGFGYQSFTMEMIVK